MRGKELLDKMELIDPDYVKAADVKPGKKGTWTKWGAMAAGLCLIVIGSIVISRINQKQDYIADTDTGWSVSGYSRYPYDDTKVLDYIGKTLDNIQTDAGEIVFNEIIDIDAYRKFNTMYGYEDESYYSTRTTAYELLSSYPAADENEQLKFAVFERDGSIENCPGYDDFTKLAQKIPAVEELIMRIFEKEDISYADVCYDAGIDAAGFSFRPADDCIAAVVIGKDLSAIDERFLSILPVLQGTLGTGDSSCIGGQEVSVHYFYQNRLFQGSETEEAYQYYVYYERDGLQYLYQFSSNWSLIDKNFSAIHNPPASIHYVETQEECRRLFVEYLLGQLGK